MATTRKATAVGEATNGGAAFIAMAVPYQVRVEVTGVADIILHRWNCEAIERKAAGPKGGREKRTDDIESYVYRDETGAICLPSPYMLGAVVNAARFRQDPRSPRKSAADLFKAGVVSLTPLASFGTKEWDYEDRRRVQVQRNGVTRVRPAFRAGWTLAYDLQVVLPEYIAPDFLHDTLANAGRLIGLAELRPTYGRFAVTHFKPIDLR
jgi:hypothetical protein